MLLVGEPHQDGGVSEAVQLFILHGSPAEGISGTEAVCASVIKPTWKQHFAGLHKGSFFAALRTHSAVASA